MKCTSVDRKRCYVVVRRWAHKIGAGGSIPLFFTVSSADQVPRAFKHDKTSDTWRWLINNVENGRVQHFAKVTLRRRKQGDQASPLNFPVAWLAHFRRLSGELASPRAKAR